MEVKTEEVLITRTQQITTNQIHYQKIKKVGYSPTVISFLPENIKIPDIVLDTFFEIGRKISKHIMLLDCTSEKLVDIIRYFYGDVYFQVFLPNPHVSSGSKAKYSSKVIYEIESKKIITLNEYKWQYDKFPDTVGPLNELISMIDKKDNFHGAGTYKKLQILHDGFFEMKNVKTQKIFLDYFRKVFLDFYAKPNLDIFQKMNTLTDKYIGFSQKYHRHLQQVLINKRYTISDAINSYWRGLQKSERELVDTFIIEKSLKRKASRLIKTIDKTTILKSLHTMFDEHMYEEIEFNNTYFYARTGDIYIKTRGYKYYIGKFDIQIKFDGTISFTNTVHPSNECCHPHVSNHGACFGNIQHLILPSITGGNYIGLLTLLHSFLTTYNKSGPFLEIQNGWQDYAIEWCMCCDIVLKKCKCKLHYCGDCNEEKDKCVCVKCPASDELITDRASYCEDCESVNGDGECVY